MATTGSPDYRDSGLVFAPDFVIGSATASYQIEGAVHEDGRGPSIWDTFSHTPGKTTNGDTGDIADDHYHRLDSDLDLMKSLGLEAYRFSIAWPRIQADGTGKPNEKGLAFYGRLVDGLLDRGIRPIATLYHWDLPQALEDAGGWVNRDTASRFAEYAAHTVEALGDRVHTWTTFNEPWCSAYLGYGSGAHAPGRTDGAAALAAVHHLNLAHGLAVPEIRRAARNEPDVSITLNLHVIRASRGRDARGPVRRGPAAHRRPRQPRVPQPPAARPLRRRPADRHRRRHRLGVPAAGRRGADPPADRRARRQLLLDRDREDVGRRLTARERGRAQGHRRIARGRAAPTSSSWRRTGPYTEMGWNIAPDGLEELLVSLHEQFPAQTLMVTENGAAFADRVVETEDGKRVPDADRVDYLNRHFTAAHRAISRGVDLQGYFVWSLLDNFEWGYGYTKRFGIVRVDYETQERIVKDSGRWLQQLDRDPRDAGGRVARNAYRLPRDAGLRAARREALLQQHRDHDDRALHDGLNRCRQVVLREDIDQRREDQHAEHGAHDGSASADEQGATDDDRGDGIELVQGSVGRGADAGAAEHHDAGDPGGEPGEHVEHHGVPLDLQAGKAGRLEVAAECHRPPPEGRAREQEPGDELRRSRRSRSASRCRAGHPGRTP